MQRIGTAVARRAGARHHGNAGAGFHHPAYGLEAAHVHALANAFAQAAGDVFEEGLDGAVRMDAHELVGIDQVDEVRGLLRRQRMIQRRHHGEFIAEQGRDVQPFHIDVARHQPQVARARADRDDDVARDLLFQFHVHVRVFRKKRGERIGQEGIGGRGVGQQAQAPLQAACVGLKIRVQALELAEDGVGVLEQHLARRRQRDAGGHAHQQPGLEGLFHVLHPSARRGQGQKGPFRGTGQVECFPHVQKQTQVGQVMSHVPPRRRGSFLILNSANALPNLPWCIPVNQTG
ncbi:hypothetical protein D9M68_613240 [compost metagenome]